MDGTPPPLWPADRVERRPLASLTPYAQNARTHSAAQVAQVAASMAEWGWTNPVLVDEGGGIIAGHCRVLAAGQLGFTEAPVMVAAGWTEVQKRAYVLADNQLALNAGWDGDMRASELTALNGAGFDMNLLGFDDIDALLARAAGGKTDPDDVPSIPATPAARMGDVWRLGRHRLVCGDATTTEAVTAALGGARPHLMVTDPPYGVSYDASFRNGIRRANGTIFGARAIGKVLNDGQADWRAAWALFPGDVAYVWHAGRHAAAVQASLEAVALEIRCQIIWAKHQFAIGRGDYHWQHEPCWYAVRKGTAGHWQGDRTQSTLWQIDKPHKSETGHSTQKPVECMRRPIENNSASGEAVYEPFAGSFTTGIACEMTGRICHAIELSPTYVDVGILRWQNFTGSEGTLDATGEAFSQVQERRLAEASERPADPTGAQ